MKSEQLEQGTAAENGAESGLLRALLCTGLCGRGFQEGEGFWCLPEPGENVSAHKDCPTAIPVLPLLAQWLLSLALALSFERSLFKHFPHSLLPPVSRAGTVGWGSF